MHKGRSSDPIAAIQGVEHVSVIFLFCSFFIPLLASNIPNMSGKNTKSLFLFLNFKPSNVLGNGGYVY